MQSEEAKHFASALRQADGEGQAALMKQLRDLAVSRLQRALDAYPPSISTSIGKVYRKKKIKPVWNLNANDDAVSFCVAMTGVEGLSDLEMSAVRSLRQCIAFEESGQLPDGSYSKPKVAEIKRDATAAVNRLNATKHRDRGEWTGAAMVRQLLAEHGHDVAADILWGHFITMLRSRDLRPVLRDKPKPLVRFSVNGDAKQMTFASFSSALSKAKNSS